MPYMNNNWTNMTTKIYHNDREYLKSNMRKSYTVDELLDIIAACRDACGPLMRLESGVDVEAVGNPEMVPAYIKEVIESKNAAIEENQRK